MQRLLTIATTILAGHKKRLRRHWVLAPVKGAALTAMAGALTAPSIAQDLPDDDVHLEVKPVLCVTDNRNPSCNVSFLVTWQSGTTGYYCVFNDFSDDALRCWSEERSGRMTDDRTVDESFAFWMTGEDLASRLAEVEIEVLRLDSDDRRRRRRTRHVWDIQ